MRKESVFVRELLKTLNAIPNCKAIKTHGNAYVSSGTPDIFGSINGQAFLVECKIIGGSVRPKQEYELRQWEASGAKCYVLFDEIGLIEDFLTALKAA